MALMFSDELNWNEEVKHLQHAEYQKILSTLEKLEKEPTNTELFIREREPLLEILYNLLDKYENDEILCTVITKFLSKIFLTEEKLAGDQVPNVPIEIRAKLMHTLFAFMQKSCKKSELYYFTVMAIKGLFIHLQDQVKINLLPERLICDLVSEFLAAINETGKENESKKIHAALGDVIVLFSEKLHDEEEITTIFNGVVNYVLHEPVSADLCFAVQSIANIFSKSHKQRCEMAQILEKMMSFFDNDALRRPATQVIGEIVAYEDEPAVTKLLNEFDLLERIYTILCSHENVLDHCYWILYNISVTSDDHTKLICFHEKLFPKILEHFRTLEEGKPLMSIIYLIHCAIHRISGESDSSLFLETLIAQKVPVTLCKWLYSEKQGSTCLDCLDVMLNKAEKLVNGDTVVFNPVAIQIAECNGIEKLHKFVESASVQNGKRVTKLLSKHFGEQFAASRRVWTTKKAV